MFFSKKNVFLYVFLNITVYCYKNVLESKSNNKNIFKK